MSSFPKQVSLHGQRVYVTPDDKIVSKSAFVAGGERSHGRRGGNIVLPGSPDTVAQFDDFLGDLVADEWAYLEADTGGTGAIIAGGGGVFRLTPSATSATTPQGAVALNGGLLGQWKAEQGNLRMAARVRISALNGSQNVFVGFTDSGGLEMPFYDTGGGLISNATDGVGFMYGGSGSTGTTWQGVGVKADTDATAVACDAPSAGLWDVLEVRVGDTGNGADGDKAYFYQNGVLKGSMVSPLTGSTALIPSVYTFARDTGAFNVDVDYINVSANRDTGI